MLHFSAKSSIYVKYSYVCMDFRMPDLLTTDEAAAYLRLSERKLYELVANGVVPCTKVTGRWLFPKAALDRWLQRLARGEVTAAAIHLHRLDGNDANANCDAVASASGFHDAVVIALARREQGLVVAAGNPLQLSDIASIAAKRARLALRPQGAGAQLLLLALLARAGLALDGVAVVRPVCPTGADVAQAVRVGRADCGVATRAVAHTAGLDFAPLTWEHFDLVLRQRDYFLAGPQALFKFVGTAAFRERAKELAGYDVSDSGNVRWVN
jgi:putative molybdopterin biosynthesis protein